jgi:hypothetical protein
MQFQYKNIRVIFISLENILLYYATLLFTGEQPSEALDMRDNSRRCVFDT